MNRDDFTVSEKILLAADKLDRQGRSPFVAEALIVAAWEEFPGTFGLRGFEDKHPDSHKVLCSLMGDKGMVRRGWLVKPEPKLYALTRTGKDIIRRLNGQDETPAAAPRVLDRQHDRAVQSLLDSHAVQLFEESRKSEITFTDACRMWQINERQPAAEIDARLADVKRVLVEVTVALADADGVMASGRVVNDGEVRVLSHVHEHLLDRFERHINLMKAHAQRKAVAS